jgi:hypothetical protein
MFFFYGILAIAKLHVHPATYCAGWKQDSQKCNKIPPKKLPNYQKNKLNQIKQLFSKKIKQILFLGEPGRVGLPAPVLLASLQM